MASRPIPLRVFTDYADCEKAFETVTDPESGRVYLPDVEDALSAGLMERLLGMHPRKFKQLTKQERAEAIQQSIEQKEDALGGYVRQAAKQIVRRFDRKRRVNLDQGSLMRDDLIPLEENVRITVARAGRAEWLLFSGMLADQVKAQVEAENKAQRKIKKIVDEFANNPGCTTTEDLFITVGWSFDDQPEVEAA